MKQVTVARFGLTLRQDRATTSRKLFRRLPDLRGPTKIQKRNKENCGFEAWSHPNKFKPTGAQWLNPFGSFVQRDVKRLRR